MEAVFLTTKPVFEKFLGAPNIEFEFRLGKIIPGAAGTKSPSGSFDTNIGKDSFEKILRGLKQYQGWESTKTTSDMVYSSGPIRLTIDDDTEESVQISKKKLFKQDHFIPGKPFDVRFSVSSETPVNLPDHEYTQARQRRRESFVRKNVRIDMTVVSGNPTDMDSEDMETYQAELEIIDPSKVGDQLYNVIHKIHNILELV